MKMSTRLGVAIGLGTLLLGSVAKAASVACDFTMENFGGGTGQTGSFDLSLANATCNVAGVGGNAIFQVPTGPYSVGTGLIEPFLTIQQNTAESGFNTDQKVSSVKDKDGKQLDIKRTGQTGSVGFTNSLRLGAIPVVSWNNALYREILLDFNQNAGEEHLSLDVIRLFMGTSSVGDLADYYSNTPGGHDWDGLVKEGGASGTALTPIWSLDSAALDQVLLLDYRLCSNATLGACPKGSGNTYDVRYLLPVGLFSAYTNEDYFVMYTSFGWQGGCKKADNAPAAKGKSSGKVGVNAAPVAETSYCSNDGFEEWAVRLEDDYCVANPNEPICTPRDVPEPGTLGLLGLGLFGLGFGRRRSAAKA